MVNILNRFYSGCMLCVPLIGCVVAGYGIAIKEMVTRPNISRAEYKQLKKSGRLNQIYEMCQAFWTKHYDEIKSVRFLEDEVDRIKKAEEVGEYPANIRELGQKKLILQTIERLKAEMSTTETGRAEQKEVENKFLEETQMSNID